MNISSKLPVMVVIDNVGAIFMAGNVTMTAHTKDLDIRFKDVNECVEDCDKKCVSEIS